MDKFSQELNPHLICESKPGTRSLKQKWSKYQQVIHDK